MLKLGQILFRFRDFTPLPFVIVIIIYAKADQYSFMIGTTFMVFGELIRVFGVSQIGGVSRTKTFSVGQKLITAGLFSHVRNPLYLGNLFLSSGIVIFSNVSLLFTLLFIVLFFLQYIPIVYWEESNLKNIFGAEYEEYAQKVPRWLPLLVPKIIIRKNQKRNFWGALVSEKYTLFAAVTLYVLIWWRSGWLVI